MSRPRDLKCTERERPRPRNSRAMIHRAELLHRFSTVMGEKSGKRRSSFPESCIGVVKNSNYVERRRESSTSSATKTLKCKRVYYRIRIAADRADSLGRITRGERRVTSVRFCPLLYHRSTIGFARSNYSKRNKIFIMTLGECFINVVFFLS